MSREEERLEFKRQINQLREELPRTIIPLGYTCELHLDASLLHWRDKRSGEEICAGQIPAYHDVLRDILYVPENVLDLLKDIIGGSVPLQGENHDLEGPANLVPTTII